MYQSVFSNNLITDQAIKNRYISELNQLGNTLLNHQMLGLECKVNYNRYLNIKYFLPVIDNLDNTNFLKHCLNNCNKKDVINKLSSLVSLKANVF